MLDNSSKWQTEHAPNSKRLFPFKNATHNSSCFSVGHQYTAARRTTSIVQSCMHSDIPRARTRSVHIYSCVHIHAFMHECIPQDDRMHARARNACMHAYTTTCMHTFMHICFSRGDDCLSVYAHGQTVVVVVVVYACMHAMNAP
jgi:hypothetical protein